MESLFEKYVAKMLQKAISNDGNKDCSIKAQIQSEYLTIQEPKAFLLKPDLVIFMRGRIAGILDTKWKLIDQNTLYTNGKEDPKSGISQADIYQMFAYGHKYLGGLEILC